jgi:hypothetical protein
VASNLELLDDGAVANRTRHDSRREQRRPGVRIVRTLRDGGSFVVTLRCRLLAACASGAPASAAAASAIPNRLRLNMVILPKATPLFTASRS